MPQVDIVTFYPIVFWTALVYLGGLLALSLDPLFTFINATKLIFKRELSTVLHATQRRKMMDTLTTFPLIAL